MKKLLLGTVTLAAMAAAGSAWAADLPTKAPIYKAPVVVPVAYSWTGCYIGGNAGGKWARVTNNSINIPATGAPSPAVAFPVADATDSTFIGGGQIGCNWQTGNWVFGVEGDGDWHRWSQSTSGLVNGLGPAFPVTQDISSRWQASIRGRLGYAWDRFLLYATGGVSFTNVRVNTTFPAFLGFAADIASDTQTFAGPTVGAGIEYALWQNWSLGVEGRYTWYGSKTFSGGPLQVAAGPTTFAPVTDTLKLNTFEVTARLNWKFDWTSPVVTRY